MAIANASGVTTRPIRTQALYTSAFLGNMKKWTAIHRHTANPTAISKSNSYFAGLYFMNVKLDVENPARGVKLPSKPAPK